MLRPAGWAKRQDGDFMNMNRTYLKNNPSAHGSVAERLKMLTYYVYATLFHRFALCPEP